MKTAEQIQNSQESKEEVIKKLKVGYTYADKIHQLEKKQRKKTGNSNFVYLFPFNIILMCIPLSLIGIPIPWTSLYFYISLLVGWYIATITRRKLIAKRKVKYAAQKRDIANDFQTATGYSPKLCSLEKITYMLDFLETGQADTLKEALNLADKKYHQARVIANQEYILKTHGRR